MVGRGLGSKEIADLLSITERTVKANLRTIFEKFGVWIVGGDGVEQRSGPRNQTSDRGSGRRSQYLPDLREAPGELSSRIPHHGVSGHVTLDIGRDVACRPPYPIVGELDPLQRGSHRTHGIVQRHETGAQPLRFDEL
jgi:hypothetical protein